MKIKVLRSPGKNSGFPALTEGQLTDVEDGVGRRLVAIGLAECLDQPPVVLKAIPAPASLTTDPVNATLITGAGVPAIVEPVRPAQMRRQEQISKTQPSAASPVMP